jgi:hypothetical protein
MAGAAPWSLRSNPRDLVVLCKAAKCDRQAAAMTLLDRIERAFGHRVKPLTVVEPNRMILCDEEDALWFEGRDWRDISREDWESLFGAFAAFQADAFRYYLPSILSISARNPDDCMIVAEFLLQILDRSPTVDWWDSFLTTRLLGLEDQEYETIKDWILFWSRPGHSMREDILARAYETVELLRLETDKRRRGAGI